MRLALACLFVCALSAVASEYTFVFTVAPCDGGPIPGTIGLTLVSDCHCPQHVNVCLKPCPDSCGNWVGKYCGEKLCLDHCVKATIDGPCQKISCIKIKKSGFLPFGRWNATVTDCAGPAMIESKAPPAAPKADAPKEAPKAPEAPKTDAPKAPEAPKADAPKPATPAVK